jgi:hypothetical protein
MGHCHLGEHVPAVPSQHAIRTMHGISLTLQAIVCIGEHLWTDCTTRGADTPWAPPFNMRAGFLGQQEASKPHSPAREDSAHDASGGTQAGGAPRPGAGAAATATPGAGLAECLDLLQGPTDERRCV